MAGSLGTWVSMFLLGGSDFPASFAARVDPCGGSNSVRQSIQKTSSQKHANTSSQCLGCKYNGQNSGGHFEHRGRRAMGVELKACLSLHAS